MDRLAARVALVTGAGQGIGRGIALLFAREGARVCVAELKEHRAERTAQEIRAAGGEAFALVADVGRREDVDRMVEETVRRWGRVDVLVNNAHGFGARAPLEEISEAQFDLSWRSGVKGTWWAMCAARPHMAARGWGRIINMVSLAAERGDAGLGEHNAAKAGIAALTRTAARAPLGARGLARRRRDLGGPGLRGVAQLRERRLDARHELAHVGDQVPVRREAPAERARIAEQHHAEPEVVGERHLPVVVEHARAEEIER